MLFTYFSLSVFTRFSSSPSSCYKKLLMKSQDITVAYSSICRIVAILTKQCSEGTLGTGLVTV